MRALASTSETSPSGVLFRAFIVVEAFALLLRDVVDSQPLAYTTALTAILIQPLWIYRMIQGDGIWPQDLFLCLCIDYWRRGGLGLLKPGFYQWLEQTQYEHKSIYGVLLLSVLFSTAIVARGDAAEPIKVTEIPDRLDEHLLPPLLIPGRTNHTRIFPKKHSFSYSYFYVGIPVGWRGRSGSALSADVDLLPPSQRHTGWFNVNAADYLDRGDHSLGLEDKLRRYLRREGVPDKTWSFAYLVTAPRFLGYSFNPVSFWYLYDQDSELTMMVLEVNNTFGERRLYLLKADHVVDRQDSGTNGSDADLEEVEQIPYGSIRFTNAWSKDFHVSPFNSRKGFYALTAKNPLDSTVHRDKMIDNTITLKSSKNHPKIVARVFSEGPARDPSTMSHAELIPFLITWFWVGFVTFPRIVREAFKLFFLRKLHVWYRPEVLPTSIGRSHVDIEEKLEAFFRAYLGQLVETSPLAVELLYEPANGMGERWIWKSSTARSESKDTRTFSVRILSPAFYSRFVHYAHTQEAFDREGSYADNKNRTVEVSQAALLAKILQLAGKDKIVSENKVQSVLDNARWIILKTFRCPPAAVSYPQADESLEQFTVTDIRTLDYSPMDRFVREACEDADIYRRVTTKLFLAERYAFGITALVTTADILVRAFVLVITMHVLDTGLSLSFSKLAAPTKPVEIAANAISLVSANLIHLWSLIK